MPRPPLPPPSSNNASIASNKALITCENLKIWKGAALESQDLIGQADYLLTQRRGYVEAPLLCVVEAKKDDFEQGAAQCLVEMKACQWNNQ